MAYKKSNPNSQASSANSEPVVLSTEQEAKIDLLATKAKQDLLLTELQLKADLTETQPVSIAGTVAVSGPLTDAQLRATAVPVSGTFWQATQPVSGTFFQATQPVSLATNTPTLQPSTNNIGDVDIVTLPPTYDVFGTGTLGALNAAVTVSSNGISGCIINIRGTLVGTVVLEGSTDGFTTSQNISVLDLSTGLSTSSGMAAAGYYRGINTAAWVQLRIRVSAYTSGSSTGTINLSTEHNIFTVVQQKAANLNVTSVAPTPLFKGRAATFRTPGRAGTAGQNIMAIHNATGSAVTVKVTKVVVDMYQTVVKAVTVPPPNIRIWKVTVLPTNGTVLAKTKIGGTTTSSASVDVRGDASADGTGSATTLTTTRPAGAFIAQKFASRLITAAGYEPVDTIEYLDGSEVTLSALEGLVVFLDYTVATMNPVTDMWTAYVEWSES